MRAVLLQLELTSNGRTTSFDATRASEPDYIPRFDVSEPLHVVWARRWATAAGDEAAEREVLAGARQDLDATRRRTTPPAARSWETLEQRDARIVAQGEGVPLREVAIWARCSERDVRRARAAAGRDEELGRVPRYGRALEPTERRSEVARMYADGMPARQISFALGLSYSTVLRYLGKRR